jgi:hypothetical protein
VVTILYLSLAKGNGREGRDWRDKSPLRGQLKLPSHGPSRLCGLCGLCCFSPIWKETLVPKLLEIMSFSLDPRASRDTLGRSGCQREVPPDTASVYGDFGGSL